MLRKKQWVDTCSPIQHFVFTETCMVYFPRIVLIHITFQMANYLSHQLLHSVSPLRNRFILGPALQLVWLNHAPFETTDHLLYG